MLATISVGTDGSATARSAFAWAAGVHGATGANLRVINVWTSPVVTTYAGTSPSTETLIGQARAAIRSTLTATDFHPHVDSVIVHGSPGPSLTAEAAGTDLLVIGRNQAIQAPPAFGEALVGSTARYCINHASAPVAVIPADATWSVAPNVLVGIDGSATSLAALRWAAMSLPPDASIHAVHAMIHPCRENSTPIDYELLDPLIANNKAQLRGLVADTTDGLNRSIRSHVLLGSALDILLDPGFVCDLVILGEHGETAAATGVLGSVADHTVRNASVPLIVVPSATDPSGKAS